MLRKILIATVWAILGFLLGSLIGFLWGGLIGWLGGWLLGNLIYLMSWRTYHREVTVDYFSARSMALGQIIGVLMGGIFGSKTKSP